MLVALLFYGYATGVRRRSWSRRTISPRFATSAEMSNRVHDSELSQAISPVGRAASILGGEDDGAAAGRQQGNASKHGRSPALLELAQRADQEGEQDRWSWTYRKNYSAERCGWRRSEAHRSKTASEQCAGAAPAAEQVGVARPHSARLIPVRSSGSVISSWRRNSAHSKENVERSGDIESRGAGNATTSRSGRPSGVHPRSVRRPLAHRMPAPGRLRTTLPEKRIAGIGMLRNAITWPAHGPGTPRRRQGRGPAAGRHPPVARSHSGVGQDSGCRAACADVGTSGGRRSRCRRRQGRR